MNLLSCRLLGLSMGQFGLGLCPTRNRPDQFGSLISGPVANRRRESDRVLGTHRILVGPRLELKPSKSTDFGQDWVKSAKIRPDLDEISSDLNKILVDLEEISPDLD